MKHRREQFAAGLAVWSLRGCGILESGPDQREVWMVTWTGNISFWTTVVGRGVGGHGQAQGLSGSLWLQQGGMVGKQRMETEGEGGTGQWV